MPWPTAMVVTLCSQVTPALPRLITTRADRRREQQVERAELCKHGEAARLAAEHIVDDELQRPRLQELEAGDEEDLSERP